MRSGQHPEIDLEQGAEIVVAANQLRHRLRRDLGKLRLVRAQTQRVGDIAPRELGLGRLERRDLGQAADADQLGLLLDDAESASMTST